MGKSYYRKKNDSWTKVIQDTIKDTCHNITKNIGKGGIFLGNKCNPAARICIYTLIGITLLFSGLGLYAWITLIMLLIILQFV